LINTRDSLYATAKTISLIYMNFSDHESNVSSIFRLAIGFAGQIGRRLEL
jgi:hypothetical protein